MKKVLSLIIAVTVLSMCIFSICLADDFTTHNGVIFGMSKDEVKQKESAGGFSLETTDADFSRTSGVSVLMGKGKIAGIDPGTVFHVFDRNDELFSTFYMLGMNDSLEQSDYDSVENALKKKYGDQDKAWLPIAYSIGFEPLNYALQYVTDPSVPADYSSWLIPLDDGNYVVISHFAISASLYGINLYWHIVGYQVYNSDVISSELNRIQNKINENQEQLADDL